MRKLVFKGVCSLVVVSCGLGYLLLTAIVACAVGEVPCSRASGCGVRVPNSCSCWVSADVLFQWLKMHFRLTSKSSFRLSPYVVYSVYTF